LLTGANNNTIYHCDISGSAGTGVRMNNGDNNYLINNNVFRNSGDGINLNSDSDNNIFQKNRIYDNSQDGLEIASADCDNNLVINNTVYKNTANGINNSGTSTVLKNLITRQNSLGIQSTPVLTVAYSCVNDNKSGSVTLAGTSITNDPLFCNESIRDFHLKWNSPCIGTGEANNVPSCMGAQTVYIRLANNTAGNITFATVFFTTSYQLGSVPPPGAVNLSMDEEIFGLQNATNAEGLSSWGGVPGTFNVIYSFDPFDAYLNIIRMNDGNASTAGDTENILIRSFYNAAIGSNHCFLLRTKSSNRAPYYLEDERSNDFLITGFSNFFVQWSTGNDANPGTRTQPWKTVQFAADKLKPGQVVTVLPGIQYEQVLIRTNGRPWGQVITYRAEGDVTVTPVSNTVVKGPYAFYVDDADWIRINGFKIKGATNSGVYVRNANRVLFLSNQVYGNTNCGFRLDNSSQCAIRYSRIYDTRIGISITNGNTNLVRGNIIHDSVCGIRLTGNQKEDDICENNVYNNNSGIFLNGGSVNRNRVWNNGAHSVQMHGIRLTNCNYNKITGNTNKGCTNGITLAGHSQSNILSGNRNINNIKGILLLDAAVSNLISGNVCSNNQEGIHLKGRDVRNNILSLNRCSINDKGILLESGLNNILGSSNLVSLNNYGICAVSGASSNIITNNQVCFNINYGIYLNADRNRIMDNRIFGSTSGLNQYAGVGVTNADNNLICGNNEIYGNNPYGLYFWDRATNNIITNNRIFGNTYYGICFNGDNVCKNRITRNRIYGPDQDRGVVFTNSGNNVISGSNDIHHNEEYGLYFCGTAVSNLIADNVIHTNGYHGIYLNGDNVRGNTILRNNIFRHTDYADCGIYINDSDLNLMGGENLIHNNYSGIYLTGDSTAAKSNTIVNNSIYSNSYSGIQGMRYVRYTFIIRNDIRGPEQDVGICFPFMGFMNWGERAYNVIYTNTIRGHDASGIILWKSSVYNVITNNRIFSNASTGISIGEWNVTGNRIKRNSIYGPRQSRGIYFSGASGSPVHDNSIKNNNQGLYFDSANSISISNNNIYSNSGYGIYFYGGNVNNNIITSNRIYGPGQTNGICISDGDNNLILNDSIHNNVSGVVFMNTATGNKIKYSSVYSNQLYGVNIISAGANNNYIVTNTIRGRNQASGIYVNQGGSETIVNNDIYDHEGSGIALSNSANSLIEYNNIYGQNTGVLYYNSSSSLFLNNITNNNFGINFKSGSFNRIEKNNLHNNNRYSFSNTSGNSVRITNNWWGSTVASNIRNRISGIAEYSDFTRYRLYGPFDIVREADTTPPDRINGLMCMVSSETVKLSWNKCLDGGFTRYSVYCSPLPGTTNLQRNLVVSNLYDVNRTNLMDRPGNGTWYYTVTALDNKYIFTNECWYSRMTNAAIYLFTAFSVAKSISNITLNSSPAVSIPGSTITYKISYSNIGFTTGQNTVIYDNLSSRVTFKTDVPGTASGWSFEYSTNVIPDQAYSSCSYISNCPAEKNKVRWIRWKKNRVDTYEDGCSFCYQVIIN
ncbi:MAG: right-handed parallel beta-helix repeat-containing protein, partial [bacterium]|nr:right-handed parallel beta-helix repeat-containing protein [bacterium]